MQAAIQEFKSTSCDCSTLRSVSRVIFRTCGSRLGSKSLILLAFCSGAMMPRSYCCPVMRMTSSETLRNGNHRRPTDDSHVFMSPMHLAFARAHDGFVDAARLRGVADADVFA